MCFVHAIMRSEFPIISLGCVKGLFYHPTTTTTTKFPWYLSSRISNLWLTMGHNNHTSPSCPEVGNPWERWDLPSEVEVSVQTLGLKWQEDQDCTLAKYVKCDVIFLRVQTLACLPPASPFFPSLGWEMYHAQNFKTFLRKQAGYKYRKVGESSNIMKYLEN